MAVEVQIDVVIVVVVRHVQERSAHCDVELPHIHAIPGDPSVAAVLARPAHGREGHQMLEPAAHELDRMLLLRRLSPATSSAPEVPDDLIL